MLEPPNIDAASIVDRVRRRFGLPVDDVEFLPVGNASSAWSFRLGGDDTSWFLKIRGRAVSPASLEVPEYLAERGIEHLITPIRTTDDQLLDVGEPFSFVVYPFLEGEPAGEDGLTEELRFALGRLLRSIHSVPLDGGLLPDLRNERFEPSIELARSIAGRVEGESQSDSLVRSFAETWRFHRTEIDHVIERTHELAERARKLRPETMICHADYHAWNVLVEPSGDFKVVDWDEVIRAPRERDLMFVSGDVADLDPEGTMFYAGYGRVEIDPVLMAYYRFEWVVQELADYGWRALIAEDVGDVTRSQAVDGLAGLFEPDDVVQAALRADEELRRSMGE